MGCSIGASFHLVSEFELLAVGRMLAAQVGVSEYDLLSVVKPDGVSTH